MTFRRASHRMIPQNKSSQRKSTGKNHFKNSDENGKTLAFADDFGDDDKSFREFVENLPVLFYALQPKPPYSPIYVSPAFAVFGYPLEDWCNDPEIWLRVIHPDDREWVFDETKSSTKTGKAVEYEYRIIGASGETHWVRDRGCLVRDSETKSIYRQGVIFDITDKKRTLADLKESEARYRNLFENANDLIYVHDLDGNYLSINNATERVFGYTRDEALKMNMSQVAVPEHLAVAKEKLKQKIDGIESRTTYEADCIAKDGKRVTLEVSSGVIKQDGVPIAIQGIARDITERKLADTALRESEAQFRILAETASDAIITIDDQGIMSFVNAGAVAMFGYSETEMLGQDITMLMPEEMRRHHTAGFTRFITTGKRNISWKAVELPGLHKDGREIQLELSFAEYNKGGRRCFTSVIRDITERKLAQQALSRSEANLAAAQRITHLGSWELEIHNADDSNENIVHWSDEVYRIFGYEPKQFDVTSAFVYSAVHPDDCAYVSKKFAEAIIEKTFFDIEARIILPNGSERLVQAQAETIFHETTGKPVKMVGTVQDITERKQAEEALIRSEKEYRDLFENANDIIYTHDLRGNFTSLNRTGEIVTGYGREEAVRMNIAQVVAPEYLTSAQRMIANKIAGNPTTAYELEIIAKDETRISLELSTRLIMHEGQPVGVQGIGRDISERKSAEQSLHNTLSLFASTFESTADGIVVLNPERRIVACNQRFIEMWEVPQEIVDTGDGNKLIEFVVQHVTRPEELIRNVEYLYSDPLATSSETLELKDGRIYERYSQPQFMEGKPVGRVCCFRDVTERERAEEQLRHYALHDTLTNLPNRVEFMNHLQHAIDRTRGSELARFAVLFLDLDRFKVINDSLGHVIGDKLLIAIAERLKVSIRPGDVVARLGGDEFTILLNRTGSVADVAHVAERLQAKLSQPFKLDNYEVFTTASIGIIIADEVPRQPEDFLRDADTAMYRAKEAGKARYEIFDREMHAHNMNVLQLETDLRHAVERCEFEVFYQPIVQLDTGAVSEFEALIRWRHPERGIVSPNDFIEVAEETGMIIPIGKWILEQACRQTARWQSKSDVPLSISVNLSAKQLMHPNLISQITEILAETGLNAKQLRLEVTESTVMEQSDRSQKVLAELSRMGITLSTDDFGTGYSSLSYLHRFPFSRLKIDRSFILKMDEDEKSEAIVKTIVLLGKNLKIDVVAEGIETEFQLHLLRSLDCKLGQGYLFSKPVNAKTAEKLVLEFAQNPAFNNAIISSEPTDILHAREIQ